jgi:hypothetical protein
MMWVKTFGEGLTPTEHRYAARLILDLLDVRGATKLVSEEGTQQKTAEYEMQAQAAAMQTQQTIQQSRMGAMNVPPSVGPEAAAAMGGGGGQAPPPPPNGAPMRKAA